MWRYREPRSFRVILFDIGHILETLSIVADKLGFELLISQAFDDQKAQKLLKLNPGKEPIFYSVLIGKKNLNN